MQNFQYKWTLYVLHSLLRVAIDERFYAHLKNLEKLNQSLRRQGRESQLHKDWIAECTKSFSSFLRLNPSTVDRKILPGAESIDSSVQKVTTSTKWSKALFPLSQVLCLGMRVCKRQSPWAWVSYSYHGLCSFFSNSSERVLLKLLLLKLSGTSAKFKKESHIWVFPVKWLPWPPPPPLKNLSTAAFLTAF